MELNRNVFSLGVILGKYLDLLVILFLLVFLICKVLVLENKMLFLFVLFILSLLVFLWSLMFFLSKGVDLLESIVLLMIYVLWSKRRL